MCKKMFEVFFFLSVLLQQTMLLKIRGTDVSDVSRQDDGFLGKSSFTESAEEELTGRNRRKIEPIEIDKETATEERFYYVVAILRKGVFYSNGALIHRSWILTAAAEFHEVHEIVRLFKARLGTSDCKRGGILVPLKSIDIHPAFKKGSPSFDLALLQIAEPVKVCSRIKPIKVLREKIDITRGKFIVPYWPRLIINGKALRQDAPERVMPSAMRYSTQSMIPSDECQAKLQPAAVELQDASLCLHPLMKYHTVCHPDVGAPVTLDDELWGITSGWTTARCPEHPSPTIITKVSSPIIKYWIQENLNKTARVIGNVYRKKRGDYNRFSFYNDSTKILF